jgi:hypothetical protein
VDIAAALALTSFRHVDSVNSKVIFFVFISSVAWSQIKDKFKLWGEPMQCMFLLTFSNFLSILASENCLLKQVLIESQNDLGSFAPKLKRSLYRVLSGNMAAVVP